MALERETPNGGPGTAAPSNRARVLAALQARLHGGQVRIDARASELALPASPSGALETLGQLNWTEQLGEVTLQASEVSLPTPETFPRFIEAEALPGAVRSFFKKYDPRGQVDLDVRARRSEGDAAWVVKGRLTPRAASCRYIHFPYLVERLQGAVSFGPDGIHFEGLSGWHAGASVRCDGHVAHSEAWTALHLRIVGRNVALSGDLYEALPDRYRAHWHYANPQGLADVYVDIQRPEGSEATGPLAPQIDVDAQLVSAALTLNDRRLTHAAGRLRIRGDQIDLDNITGDIGDAATRLSGPLRFAGPGAPLEMDLAVRSQGVRFDHRVTPRDRSGHPLGEVRFTGRGDLTGQVRRSDVADDSRYTVVVNNGVLTGFDPAIRLAGATGGMRIDPEWIWLDQLRAGTSDLWIELNGRAPRFFDRAFEIDLRAGTNDMATLRRAIIPERWRDVVGALGVSGAGKLQARLFGGATASPASGERLAEVDVEAAAMAPTAAPLPLRDVKGRLNLNSQGYEIGHSTARIGDSGHVEVSGRGGWEPDTWSQLAFDMRGVKLTREVAAGMPAGLAVLLKRLAASGTFETVGDRLRVARQADGQWEAGGRLAIRGGAMDLGLELRDLDGEISGSVQIPTAGPALVTADFVIDRGKLAGRPIERWEGHIVRAAGDAGLRLEDVRGRWCDGELIGFGTIDPESLEYEASITLQDVSFEQVFARANQPLPPAGAARVDGRVFVEGVGNDPGSRRGGGDLRLRGGSLRGSPVTAPLVEASQAGARPIDENIEQAEFRFVWEGRLLRFNRVLIETQSDSLIGEGFFDTNSQRISLTLISAPPRRARLLVIDDLLNLAREELVQYRIEGTLSEAKVRIEPLHNLAEMLRRIVAP